MSSSNRITEMQRDLDAILTQLAREVGGCQEAIKMLAKGLDDVAHRQALFERAAAKAAGVEHGE